MKAKITIQFNTIIIIIILFTFLLTELELVTIMTRVNFMTIIFTLTL